MSTSPATTTGSTAVRLRGADALPVLHRISTQALDDLVPGRARATLFCDFRGRLLHRAVVAATSDGAVWLLREDAPGAPLLAHVDRHVFREDVALDDVSGDWRVTRAFATHDALPASHAGPAPAWPLREEDCIPVEVHDGPRTVLRLVTAAEAGAAGIDEDEALRIRSGRARHGFEICEDFNPFEIGLGADVHLSKGCYTGQEALQRLITYGSVRRTLALVRGEGAAPAVPADLVTGDTKAGRLTSAVESAEGWTGLASVRHDAVGGPVSLAAGAPVTLTPMKTAGPLGRP